MRESEVGRAWLAVAVTVVLWASAFAAIRVALEAFGVFELALLRLALASIALLGVAPFVGLRRPPTRDLPRIIALGITGMTGYQLLLNAGEQTVTPGTASILVNTGPIFVALLATRFLDERLSNRAWLGVGLGFTGALLIAVTSGGGLSLSLGALLVLSAAVAQASYFVLQKPLLETYTSFEVTTYAMVAGALVLLPFVGSVSDALSNASGEALGALAFLAFGASALGFFAWAFATARLQVSRAASALYAVPVVAILVAWVWLDQLPAIFAVAGGFIAIVGVGLTNTGRIQPPAGTDSPTSRPRRLFSD
jgi:drug/metabolite transporter (DMT)-like permease